MTEELRPELKVYLGGIDAKDKLRSEHGEKASVLQKAYEAAVQELGYNNNDLNNKRKAQAVATLMFSDKYLADEGFNPLLKGNDMYKGFKNKDSVEQDILYEQMFEMTANSLAGKGSHIDRYGELTRSSFVDLVEKTQNGKLNQQMSSFIWNNVYDSGKSISDNISAYNNVLANDPILSQGRGKLDLKDQDLDSMTQLLVTSMLGRSTQSNYANAHGIEFERPE